MITKNRRPTQAMYELAQKKLGSHQNIIDWFFKPYTEGSVPPQSILNINGDFLIMEMLEKLPDFQPPSPILQSPPGPEESLVQSTPDPEA